MAPKRQPHDVPPPTPSSEGEEDSSSSEDSDSESQQLTQPQAHQDSQESSGSDSDSDSGSGTDSDSSSDKSLMPPSVVSPQPKKSTSTPTHLKANGKRPAEIAQVDKVSKKSKNVDKVDKTSKSDEKVDKGSKSDEKVDKGSKSDKSKSVEKVHKTSKKVDKGSKSKSVEKVHKTSKSDEKVDKGSKSRSVEKVHKGSKMSNGEEGSEDKKMGLFVRVFTEKDEIVLLEGMIRFKENKGADPSSDIVAFHESVEDLLSCSVPRKKIVDKIRRLKTKFMNNVRRGQNGEDPVISRPHEYKTFELSKKIWGSEVQGSEADGASKVRSSSRKRNKKESDIDEEVMDKNDAETEETEDIWSLYPCLCTSLESEAIKNFTGPMSPKEYVKKVVSGLQKEKAKELEHDWNDFILMEQQVYAKRVKMISKQVELAMNVIQP